MAVAYGKLLVAEPLDSRLRGKDGRMKRPCVNWVTLDLLDPSAIESF